MNTYVKKDGQKTVTTLPYHEIIIELNIYFTQISHALRFDEKPPFKIKDLG